MPIIKIQFDDAIVKHNEMLDLSHAAQKIVSEVTGIKDVLVYGDSSQINVNISPIEIFVEMKAELIKDQNALVAQIKEKLSAWKKENNFTHPINLTLIPMNWQVEIGI